MNVSDKTHPHHAVWREHVQSVLNGKTKTVEFQSSDGYRWLSAIFSSSGVAAINWDETVPHRIARLMVTRTITYPAPMTEVPENGILYWVFHIFSNDVNRLVWRGDGSDHAALKNKMAFATEEDAKAAALAIFGVQE